MDYVILFFGVFIAFAIDIIWWTQKSFSKIERGFESHEHYHIAIELIILYLVIDYFFEIQFVLLAAMALGFLAAEWTQSKEIIHKKVIPGHPFAYGSAHFRSSTIIGIILCVLAIVIYFL
jgi:hypothetical protein